MTMNLQPFEVKKLNSGSWALTLPKEVRKKLRVNLASYRILNFKFEADIKEVSINIGGQADMGSSEFLASNQITFPTIAREKLELEKGISRIGFYDYDGKILIRKIS